jgi:hypothetical protein
VLDARQSRTIPVSGRSDELGKLDTRTTGDLHARAGRRDGRDQPDPQARREAPRHADLCDPIEVRYVISNVGVGTETEVRIDETLPEGLTTAEGQRAVGIAVGDMPQGQSKTFTIRLKAARTGEFTSRAAGARLWDGGAVGRADDRRPRAEAHDRAHGPGVGIRRQGRAVRRGGEEHRRRRRAERDGIGVGRRQRGRDDSRGRPAAARSPRSARSAG